MSKRVFVVTKVPVRSYQDKPVYLFDQIIVPSECRLKIRFESVASEWRQGVRLGDMTSIATNLEMTIDKQTASGVRLWADTCTSEIDIRLKSPNQTLFLYNIWDIGNGQSQSQTKNAGMLIEPLGEGVTRYFCNDGHATETFSHLIFSLQIFEPD